MGQYTGSKASCLTMSTQGVKKQAKVNKALLMMICDMIFKLRGDNILYSLLLLMIIKQECESC